MPIGNFNLLFSMNGKFLMNDIFGKDNKKS